MKKLIIPLVVLLMLASCKKEVIEPKKHCVNDSLQLLFNRKKIS
jgi:hypothetical protein